MSVKGLIFVTETDGSVGLFVVTPRSIRIAVLGGPRLEIVRAILHLSRTKQLSAMPLPLPSPGRPSEWVGLNCCNNKESGFGIQPDTPCRGGGGGGRADKEGDEVQ